MDALHDEVRQTVVLTHREDGHDGRVVQPGREFHLAVEPATGLARQHQAGPQELDRHLPAARLLAPEPHDAHRAAPQGPQQAVPVEHFGQVDLGRRLANAELLQERQHRRHLVVEVGRVPADLAHDLGHGARRVLEAARHEGLDRRGLGGVVGGALPVGGHGLKESRSVGAIKLGAVRRASAGARHGRVRPMDDPDDAPTGSSDIPLPTLLERHLPALQTYVRLKAGALLRARESCTDLAQSVCRELLTDQDALAFENDATFRACLYQAAERKIIDRHRYYTRQKRDVNRTISLQEAEVLATSYARIASPSTVAGARERVRMLEAAFDELPDEHRDVILLFQVAGLSHREIADQLGRTETACRSLLSRAQAKLGRLLRAFETGQRTLPDE